MSAIPAHAERIVRIAPLGLYFADHATGARVDDGLSVVAVSERGERVTPIRNRVGIFGFNRLPGVRELAPGQSEDSYFEGERPFVIEVDDTLDRYLPARFDAGAPFESLFELDCLSPPSPPSETALGVPLFSTRARPAPTGMTIVRSRLWDDGLDAPAVAAVLRVRPSGGAWASGVADPDGFVAAPLAYPEPAVGAQTRPLAEERWTLEFEVLYERLLEEDRRDPCALLEQERGSFDANPWPDTLRYGQELVVRSTGRDVLPVSPA